MKLRYGDWKLLVAFFFGICSIPALAFQIAPLGTDFEARLTNEPESSLAWIAGKLGKVLKKPVHEEVTQLAFACPVETKSLAEDEICADGNAGFANHFIVYGVRWNDLPPFRLRPNEGRRCKKLISRTPACNVKETIRFSTQPECWYCLFTEAEKFTSRGGKIAGCKADKAGRRHVAIGSLLTRSHFGDLQFLHSMAIEDDLPPEITQQQILDWIEFAWKVAIGEIKSEQRLASIEIKTIGERFGCTEWTVSDLYILGRKDKMLRNLNDVALGSILHTVQDSFSSSHTDREPPVLNASCPGTNGLPRPGRIREFHNYGMQDGELHDHEDARMAMMHKAIDWWPEAIEASRNIVDFYRARSAWADAAPYFRCLFELGEPANKSSPGEKYRRVSNSH